MANFKSVVLFLKIISLFIVQRNFGKIAKYVDFIVACIEFIKMVVYNF